MARLGQARIPAEKELNPKLQRNPKSQVIKCLRIGWSSENRHHLCENEKSNLIAWQIENGLFGSDCQPVEP